MNILMVGSGKGSWQVRGVQLGAAIGARVSVRPLEEDFAWADVVVLVKRAGAVFAKQAHASGKPIVWDALDFWSQPEENRLNESQARALLQAQIRVIQPTLVIGATEAMARDCGGVYLPHHSWAGLTPAPVRDVVRTVGYQGKKAYLGRWAAAIERECAARGWSFVVNPPDLRAVDILVAFRDGQWDGWMCREWKSGVKIANAMAAGRPMLCQPSAAWAELGATGTAIESPAELSAAFDEWTPRALRSGAWPFQDYTLPATATRHRRILERVCLERAA